MKSFGHYAGVAVVAALALHSSLGLLAQSETIPEAVARGAKGRSRSQPSGPVPNIRELLSSADLVVRGAVADSVSYLSDDQKDVYTDHLLTNTTVLFRSAVPSSAQPGPPTPIVVTQLGGAVLLGDVTFTQVEEGLPQFERGSEGLFIAVNRGGKFHLAQVFYGAFQIRNGRFTPLAGRKDFATELRDLPVATALGTIQTRLQEVRQPNQ